MKEIILHYFKRSLPDRVFQKPLGLYAQDGEKALWTVCVDFPEETHYIKYCFEVTDTQGKNCFYSEHGFSEEAPATGFFELLQVNPGQLPTAPAWAEGAIFYQIFPERFANSGRGKSHELVAWSSEPRVDNYFGGDLEGIRGKLPYLQELGVECLYLNPIFAGDFNHKYAATDYFHVDPDFGTDEDLVRLVEDAHAHGIRIMLDGVFNHCGIHFAPFEDWVKNGSASAYASWFFPKKQPIEIDADCYECVGDYPYMPRLNTANPEVQDYILKVCRHWIDVAHIDGWRFDVADELDPSCLRHIRRSLRHSDPQVFLLGETWGDASPLTNGYDQTDSAMNYLFRDCMVDYFAHRTIDEEAFSRRIQHVLMKYTPETNALMYNLLGSHDTVRILTECGGNKDRLRMAMAFQALFVGSPAIYYGDEVGMTGENDPGCRGGMNWDDPDQALFAWQRDWNTFRKEHTAIRKGSFRFLHADAKNHLLTILREDEGEKIVAVFNMDETAHTQDFAGYGDAESIEPCSVKIKII